jgi:hypothetical protein
MGFAPAFFEHNNRDSTEENIKMHYRRFGKRICNFQSFPWELCATWLLRTMLTDNKAGSGTRINHLRLLKVTARVSITLVRLLKLGCLCHVPNFTSPAKSHQWLVLIPCRYIEQSLEQLGLDYLDCLAIHGLNTWEHLEWVQLATGCMQAVQEAIADGRVRHVGFSTHGPLEVILAALTPTCLNLSTCTIIISFSTMHQQSSWPKKRHGCFHYFTR